MNFGQMLINAHHFYLSVNIDFFLDFSPTKTIISKTEKQCYHNFKSNFCLKMTNYKNFMEWIISNEKKKKKELLNYLFIYFNLYIILLDFICFRRVLRKKGKY